MKSGSSNFSGTKLNCKEKNPIKLISEMGVYYVSHNTWNAGCLRCTPLLAAGMEWRQSVQTERKGRRGRECAAAPSSGDAEPRAEARWAGVPPSLTTDKLMALVALRSHCKGTQTSVQRAHVPGQFCALTCLVSDVPSFSVTPSFLQGGVPKGRKELAASWTG